MYATMHAWSENKISLAVMRLRSLTAYAALVSFCETRKLTVLSYRRTIITPKAKKIIYKSGTVQQTDRHTDRQLKV